MSRANSATESPMRQVKAFTVRSVPLRSLTR